MITANPAMDAENFYEEGMKQAAKLPKCAHCGHPIYDLDCFEINEELVCHDCVVEYIYDNCRVSVEEVC